MVLVTEREEVAAVAAAIAHSPMVCFDLEFASADRLVPVLCLVQIAWVDALDAAPEAIVPQIRMIDPIAGDAAPIVAALAAHPLVVAHAPRQDLGLLAARFGGARVPGIVDTQLMAAFAGMGDQIGLAALVQEMAGVTLAKDMQWTDWERRPLSPAQLAYAEADVRHLPAIYLQLAKRLGPRTAWARAESALIGDDAVAAASVTAQTAWQAIGGTRGLDAAAMAAVIALAAWRFDTATELDRPLGQVMTDKLIIELARHRPDSAGALRSFKGLSPHARTRADAIVAAVAGAAPVAKGRPPARAPSLRAQRWTEMVLAIVHVIADDVGIAPRLLATRADAEELARTVDERGLAAAATLPALATWRREVIGETLEGWLAGRIALVGDPTAAHGVRLVPHT